MHPSTGFNLLSKATSGGGQDQLACFSLYFGKKRLTAALCSQSSAK